MTKLSADDWRAIRVACDCPPDARRGQRCTGTDERGWIRCNGSANEWARRRAGLAVARGVR